MSEPFPPLLAETHDARSTVPSRPVESRELWEGCGERRGSHQTSLERERERERALGKKEEAPSRVPGHVS